MTLPKLLRIDSTSFNKLKQRVIKVLNAKGAYTAEEYSSYGIDSNPIKGLAAIYMRTQVDGDECIIGYLLKDKLADVGETRLFSTDSDGNLKAFAWLKSDGTIQLNGDDNFAVKFNELKTEFNKLKDDYNDLKDKWNYFCNNYVPGSGSTTGMPSSLITPLDKRGNTNTSDIDNAKNERIKTNS